MSIEATSSATSVQWMCTPCGYLYDPSDGSSADDHAGLAFEDLPEDWECPVCGVGKAEFAAI